MLAGTGHGVDLTQSVLYYPVKADYLALLDALGLFQGCRIRAQITVIKKIGPLVAIK